MTAREALLEATAQLERAEVPTPDVDAEWLVAHVLGVTRSELYADGTRELDEAQLGHLRETLGRRAEREPLAYVLGEWGFRRLTLTVDPRVLVPRPETEALVERCLELIRDLDEPRVLDIGVGSGAIALAIADEHPTARVVATDNSTDALDVARENRRRAGLDERVELAEGGLFAGQQGPFDLVVSNPPYVEPHELAGLEPEVSLFEPRGALVGPRVSERIVEGAQAVLCPGGALALETADGAAPRLASQLEEAGYRDVTITRDLAGRERVVDGRAPG